MEAWKNSHVFYSCIKVNEVTDCKNYKGVILFDIFGKVNGKILTDHDKRISEPLIGEEQGGFWRGRGWVDQTFVLSIKEFLRKEDFVWFLWIWKNQMIK